MFAISNEIRDMMQLSTLPEELKQDRYVMAVDHASAIAWARFADPVAAIGDGKFLALLIELLKILLPILLQLLKPKT